MAGTAAWLLWPQPSAVVNKQADRSNIPKAVASAVAATNSSLSPGPGTLVSTEQGDLHQWLREFQQVVNLPANDPHRSDVIQAGGLTC